MRRAMIALIGTATGTVLLVGAKTSFGDSTPPTQPLADEPFPGPPGASAAPPGMPGSAPAGTATPAASGTAGKTTAPTGKAPAAQTSTDGTWGGSTISTEYGPVQVSMTVSGGRITDVKVLKAPSEHFRSTQINETALPTLRQRALTAQNANFDNVSGATYTSEGYKASLQSAIDKARGA